MRPSYCVASACVLLAACGPSRTTTAKTGTATGSAATGSGASASGAGSSGSAARPSTRLGKARAEFPTRIKVKFKTAGPPPPVPPAATKLERVKFRGPAGELWAYVTQDPKDGKRHPAVVWAAGGFDPSIGDELITPGPVEKDESASQLREAGIVVMYPSYRGAHDNPGTYELLFGEVDDYLAAVEHVRTLSYVDPARVYFAGHSTGATLVLLAAELTDQFRAAFAIGAVTGAKSYGNSVVPFDLKSPDVDREWKLREPIRYLRDIKKPTILIEGTKSPNVRALPAYEREAADAGAPVKTVRAAGFDHYSVLASQLELIARKILADDGQGDFAW